MIAYGEQCMWWDDLAQATVVRTPHGDVFKCPKCGGSCNVHTDRESYMRMARRFELLGFTGHCDLVRWVRGKCYRTRADAQSAYVSHLVRGAA